MDIDAQLKAGSISVGLYHTAGKGTRMAPLPGAENNNKPGVKLPACAVVNGAPTPITILESVIKQTGCYAKVRDVVCLEDYYFILLLSYSISSSAL